MRLAFPLLNSSLKVAALATLAMVLQGCNQEQQSAGHGAMHPASVSIMIAKPEDVPFKIELPATLAGSKEVEVRARVKGVLESRNFEEGQRVSKGQSLFTIDLAPYQLAAERAKSQLESAKATLQQTEREVKRLKQLRADNSVSQRDYDNALLAHKVAINDAEKAAVELKQAELDLDYAHVKSPVNGIMGREFVSEGTFVPGAELLLSQITQLDPVRLRFGLSEREQLAMRRDQANGTLTLPKDGLWTTSIRLQDGSLYGHSGQVNFSDVRVNSTTGTSELQAIVPNPDFQLRPGQFVRVTLEGAVRKNAFVVPQRAVLDNGTGKFVYVAAENEKGVLVARPAPVEAGEWFKKTENGQSGNYWVIRSGLKQGDKVIVDGMARIFFPGMPVAPAADTHAE